MLVPLVFPQPIMIESTGQLALEWVVGLWGPQIPHLFDQFFVLFCVRKIEILVSSMGLRARP